MNTGLEILAIVDSDEELKVEKKMDSLNSNNDSYLLQFIVTIIHNAVVFAMYFSCSVVSAFSFHAIDQIS